MIDISVIIVNYNTAAHVSDCIQSVVEQTSGVSYELILVDNNSPERDIEHLKEKFPSVVFMQQTKNIGFGRACNIAAQQAKGRFLFFLNPDTRLKNNALLQFFSFWEQYQNKLAIAGLGCQLQNEQGKAIHSYGDFPQMNIYLGWKLKSLVARLIGKQYNIPVKPLSDELHASVDYVTGADLFLSKENFDRVNGFSSDFFLYFEETDLQYRLAQQDFQSYIIDGPQIIHQQGASTKNKPVLLRLYYFNSLLIYFKSQRPFFQYFAFKIAWSFLHFRSFVQSFTFKPNDN